LIEKSTIDDGGIVDPMKPKVIKEILAELRRCTNIRPRLVRNLVMEVPDVIEYNKSVAIIKSSAALKFVSRSDIRRAQGNDTYRCKKSINEWVEHLRHNKGDDRNIKATNFLSACMRRLYPSYNIARMIDSPRVALVPTQKDADILTSLEFTMAEKPLYQEYIEPSAKFLGAQLTPESSAEASYSNVQRRNERFIAVAARLVSSNTSLIGVYYLVANAFELPCPTLPSVTITKGHKSTRNFGMNAVVVTLPVPYHAIISSRMSNKMWLTLRASESRDRTTFVESARMGNYLNNFTSVNNSARQRLAPRPFLYNIRDLAANTENPNFDSSAGPRDGSITTAATKAFTSVIVEENAQATMMEATTMTAGILETLVDNQTTKAILLTRLEKWLFSSISGGITVRGAPATIPDVWKREMFLESAVSVGFKLSTPDVRRATQLAAAEFIANTEGQSTKAALKNTESMILLNNGLNKYTSAFDKLEINIQRVSDALQSLDIDTRSREELSTMTFRDMHCVSSFVKFLKRKSVTGGSVCPTVVINTDSFADTKLSREVKNKFKDTIDSLLAKYLAKATAEEGIFVRAKSDAIINTLFILKNMLRPSGHRSTPFNKHMVAIQLLKFELFMTKSVGEGKNKVTMDDLKQFRLGRRITKKVMRENAVIGGRTSNTSGSDMREALVAEGVPVWMFPRANYLLRKVSEDYVGCNIQVEVFLRDFNYFQGVINYVLDTYNSVVSTVVENIEIRHLRESEKVGNVELMSPVEDASYVAATIDDGTLVAYEIDVVSRLRSPKYRDTIANLFLAHYSRWSTNGYRSIPAVNEIFRQFGILGESEVAIRSTGESAFHEKITDSEYTFSLSEYHDHTTSSHNYLYINRLPGGMAICCNDEDKFIVMGIVPSGIPMINTHSTKVPEYVEDDSSEVPCYSIEKVDASLRQLSAVLNVRPRTVMAAGEMGSIVIQQAYQRIVGARRTVEDNDRFLVAIAEVTRGSWSMDTGLRTLAMVTAWITTGGDVGRVLYRNTINELRNQSCDIDPAVRLRVMSSMSAAWEWVRMCNITAGPSIDTDQVMSIVRAVSSNMNTGGGPTTIYNMAPRSVRDIQALRGYIDLETFLDRTAATLFEVPYISSSESEVITDSGEESDEWF
jgi:hypothetical protein